MKKYKKSPSSDNWRSTEEVQVEKDTEEELDELLQEKEEPIS